MQATRTQHDGTRTASSSISTWQSSRQAPESASPRAPRTAAASALRSSRASPAARLTPHRTPAQKHLTLRLPPTLPLPAPVPPPLCLPACGRASLAGSSLEGCCAAAATWPSCCGRSAAPSARRVAELAAASASAAYHEGGSGAKREAPGPPPPPRLPLGCDVSCASRSSSAAEAIHRPSEPIGHERHANHAGRNPGARGGCPTLCHSLIVGCCQQRAEEGRRGPKGHDFDKRVSQSCTPGVRVRAALRSRSPCSPEELAAGDLLGRLLLGWPESPGLVPSFRLRFLLQSIQQVTCAVDIGTADLRTLTARALKPDERRAVLCWSQTHLSGFRSGRSPRAARRVKAFSSRCSCAAIASSSSPGAAIMDVTLSLQTANTFWPSK